MCGLAKSKLLWSYLATKYSYDWNVCGVFSWLMNNRVLGYYWTNASYFVFEFPPELITGYSIVQWGGGHYFSWSNDILLQLISSLWNNM